MVGRPVSLFDIDLLEWLQTLRLPCEHIFLITIIFLIGSDLQNAQYTELYLPKLVRKFNELDDLGKRMMLLKNMMMIMQ